jgi:ABC-type transporter Mla MlaB component
MSWKVEKSQCAGRVIFEISGRLERSALSELRKVLSSEAGRAALALDLKGVRLVDADSVHLLADCEKSGARILNCPPFIREWITREKQGG